MTSDYLIVQNPFKFVRNYCSQS